MAFIDLEGVVYRFQVAFHVLFCTVKYHGIMQIKCKNGTEMRLEKPKQSFCACRDKGCDLQIVLFSNRANLTYLKNRNIYLNTLGSEVIFGCGLLTALY